MPEKEEEERNKKVVEEEPYLQVYGEKNLINKVL